MPIATPISRPPSARSPSHTFIDAGSSACGQEADGVVRTLQRLAGDLARPRRTVGEHVLEPGALFEPGQRAVAERRRELQYDVGDVGLERPVTLADVVLFQGCH